MFKNEIPKFSEVLDRFNQINENHNLQHQNSEIMSPEEVKPGMKGVNYGDFPGVVIAIEPVENYETLLKYDDSGWMDRSGQFIKDSDLSMSDWLVAVDEGGDWQSNVVYVYGEEGFVCYKNQN